MISSTHSASRPGSPSPRCHVSAPASTKNSPRSGNGLRPTPISLVFADATFCKVRVGAHVVSQALVVATGVSMDRSREVLRYRGRRQRVVRVLA
ncbi:transposase [Gordonia alkanivorans]|uniref:transposase n=1 Tax=Gordonia alkanivorans TaxID=84096 RepID=UPI003B0010CE